MAFPILTGFYPKDLILELAKGQYKLSGNVAYWLGIIFAVFTAFCSLRLVSLAKAAARAPLRNPFFHLLDALPSRCFEGADDNVGMFAPFILSLSPTIEVGVV